MSFFKLAAVHNLEFMGHNFRRHNEKGVYITVQIFAGNAAIDLIERRFGHYLCPTNGFFGHLTNNGVKYQLDPQKGTSFRHGIMS